MDGMKQLIDGELSSFQGTDQRNEKIRQFIQCQYGIEKSSFIFLEKLFYLDNTARLRKHISSGNIFFITFFFSYLFLPNIDISKYKVPSLHTSNLAGNLKKV